MVRAVHADCVRCHDPVPEIAPGVFPALAGAGGIARPHPAPTDR